MPSSKGMGEDASIVSPSSVTTRLMKEKIKHLLTQTNKMKQKKTDNVHHNPGNSTEKENKNFTGTAIISESQENKIGKYLLLT
jgi:ribosomal protein L35